MLDIVHDGELAVAGQDEVAVHAMHREVARDGPLGGREALCYDRAAVDSAGTWRMPEGPSVGEDVLRAEMDVSREKT